jgi:hypothetical protein
LDKCFAGLPAPVGTQQVATKVSADGKTRIRLALEAEDNGIGISIPWRLLRFALERDELKICVTDRTKLTYSTVSHHNCTDTATVVTTDLRFELTNPDTGRAGHPGTKVSAFQGATKLWGPETLVDTTCVTNATGKICKSGGPCN